MKGQLKAEEALLVHKANGAADSAAATAPPVTFWALNSG